jgi:cytochrome c-type biogenesis protein CcmF
VPEPLRLTACCIVAAVTLCFAVLTVAATRPFAITDPPVADGAGPNPLLADHPAMAIHPPLLYLGYVGLVVPFGYALAALVVGRPGTGWAVVTRRWTLLAWVCLTAGIALGAWWSYAVLGWGGYWAWDPVENASLLPWLTATALLHATIRPRTTGRSPVWQVALACASFLLVVSGTFFTRSGVVASVHSFTASPLGPALLGVLTAWLAITLGLLIWRGDRLSTGLDRVRFRRPVARVTAILLNQVLLVGLAIAVLVGTLLPVISGVTGTEVSVGAPYYNRLAVPIGLLLLGFVGWATVGRWHAEPGAVIRRRAVLPLAVAAVMVAALGLAGAHGVAAVLALGTAAGVVAAAGREIWSAARPLPIKKWWGARRLVAGHLAHVGLAITAAGIAASSAWQVRTEATVPVGATVNAGDAAAQVTRVESYGLPGRSETAVVVALSADGSAPTSARAALVYFSGRDQTVPVPAIAHDWRGDVYLTVLGVSTDSSTVTVQLVDEPMVGLVWAGAALMVLGGVLAVRRRAPVRAAITAEVAAHQPSSLPGPTSPVQGRS